MREGREDFLDYEGGALGVGSCNSVPLPIPLFLPSLQKLHAQLTWIEAFEVEEGH